MSTRVFLVGGGLIFLAGVLYPHLSNSAEARVEATENLVKKSSDKIQGPSSGKNPKRNIASAEFFKFEKPEKKNRIIQRNPDNSSPFSVAFALEKEADWFFKAALGYGLTSLSGHDRGNQQTVHLRTKYDINLALGVAQKWSTQWSTFQMGSLRAINFSEAGGALNSVEASKRVLPSIRFGLEYNQPRVQTSFSVGYGSEIFLKNSTATTLVVKSVYLPTGSIALSYKLFEKKNVEVGISGEGSYLFGASGNDLDISNGISYRAGFNYNEKYENKKYQIDLGLSQRRQRANQIEVTENTIFGTLSISQSWFRGGK